MSSKPISVMAAASTLGGIAGYTAARSVPSLLGGVGVGAVMAISGIRIKDQLPGGFELACGSSVVMMVPMFRRAVKTRGPIPITMGLAATASAVYYAKAVLDRPK
ncbi:uncharacterized protein EHS24_004517 [Apiotrichum porosum]|uniref:Transmembrane protein 14C n=1 Tax=Apiotrichum porosum TaxID=105984 RepID=A0A427Y5C0_9TREE|nr:uncharacterized protein EHS24_004517 [Apiotrichum porosum]RSH86279.1 hypothetical protein EHS24_004517 [Apiotrichum porosum]